MLRHTYSEINFRVYLQNLILSSPKVDTKTRLMGAGRGICVCILLCYSHGDYYA